MKSDFLLYQFIFIAIHITGLLTLVLDNHHYLGPRKSLIINSQPLEKVYHEGEDNPIWWVLSSANVNPFSRLRDKQDNQQTSLIDGNDLKQLDSNYLDDSFQLDESEHSLFPKRGDYSRNSKKSSRVNGFDDARTNIPLFTDSKILDALLSPSQNLEQFHAPLQPTPLLEQRSLVSHIGHPRPIYLTENRLDGHLSSHYLDHKKQSTLASVLFIAIVCGITLLAIFSVVGLGYGFHKIKQMKKASDSVDYPAYPVCGLQCKMASGNVSNVTPSSDRKLERSAEMFHYQYQKKQMISTEKIQVPGLESPSDPETESENEEGDYTVYECPGLASTGGEIEVKNPLFQDDPSPMISSSSLNVKKSFGKS